MHGRIVITGWLLGFSLLAPAGARADVLLTENAENGMANITTDVSGYALIQSEIVSQGTSAFHLANLAFGNDDWFRLTPAVTVQADSKLFFQSRLGYASSSQFARVQASTDGGSTWPISLFEQAGSDDAGEGGFTLKQVNLAPYASQSLRFRFYYDAPSFGSAYLGADNLPPVGWYIDDIQIADQLQKGLYSIGNPSNEEQLLLEYINRARAHALVEANRLANETDPGITSAYSFFGVTPANIVSQFEWYVNRGISTPEADFALHAQPLSFNEKLLLASELHSQDMLTNEFQGHNSSGSPPSPLVPFGGPGERLDAVGYSGGWGENVYSYAESPREAHAAFDVDWGNVTNFGDFYNPAFDGQGMQNEAGHRLSIHNAAFKEIGVGVVLGTNGSVGPQVVTQDFGDPGTVTFVTGVVYEDLNANNFYDLGEGRSGVRVDVEGSAYYALSTASGGYSVPVSGDGEYEVTFSGGGFAEYETTAMVTGGLNVKIDYLAMAAPMFAADFNNDGRVDEDDLLKWRGDFGLGAGSDADDDGDTDGADFLVWQRQLGSGASLVQTPEPATVWLIAFGLIGVRPVRKRPKQR